ncbi:MAG: hypothetical protein K1Y01_08470 [Vicinamibacteria bacterium]|nr:hypothetical protein [Vicinamibacteria bacterium]
MNKAATDTWAALALSGYWPQNPSALEALTVPTAAGGKCTLADLVDVRLPPWALDCGVEGALLVPLTAVAPGAADPDERWRSVDWWSAAAWYLSGASERAHEDARGPIHSYSYRLGPIDPRAFERAWVNRIALFLRRWAARQSGREETALFGPRPAARIRLTHDVDALGKTFAIRFKQSAFRGFRAMRLSIRGELQRARSVAASAASFAFGSGTYDRIDEVAAADEAAGLRGLFFIHARRAWRGPVDALLDPGYALKTPGLAERLRRLTARGHEVGVHPSYSSWNDGPRLAEERSAVSGLVSGEVGTCRQHWMRFSWARTWAAQEEAGFSLDSTLGFNDRPGFRVSAALRHHPWNASAGAPHKLEVLPLMVMDSHLYDYAELDPSARGARLRHFIDEVRAVGGEAAILWHPHTLSPDYGWQSGFEEMLGAVSAR